MIVVVVCVVIVLLLAWWLRPKLKLTLTGTRRGHANRFVLHSSNQWFSKKYLNDTSTVSEQLTYVLLVEYLMDFLADVPIERFKKGVSISLEADNGKTAILHSLGKHKDASFFYSNHLNSASAAGSRIHRDDMVLLVKETVPVIRAGTILQQAVYDLAVELFSSQELNTTWQHFTIKLQ